jgi:1-acyl-sn-glycerol-3-phosphate acyltransferase
LLLGLYQVTFGLYLRLRFKLKQTNLTPIPTKGPFFLLGNHTNNYDGLFMQCLFSQPIRFVVTDGVFKNKLLSPLLKLVDYIPKRKSVSDVAAIRKIMQVVKDGGIVGIFPEGGRNWDGVTGSITPATFRLIEMLKIPVVTANMRGAYLSDPRWADNKRHGRIEVQLRTVIESGSQLNLREIEQKVTDALSHNEYEWQREHRIPFKGRALTKGLERLLFVCPICGSLGTVTSSDNDASCISCKSQYLIDEYGFLHSDTADLPDDSLDKINSWQQAQLANLFAKNPHVNILMADEDGILFCAQSRDDAFNAIDTGKAVLTRRQVTIGRHGFDLSKMSGINVYFKSHLEFRYQSSDYRISFSDPHKSVYKWHCAVELAKQRTAE